MDSPVKSPAPGLEKLANELRQERQKCTNALQDRAKQKIEIERLKQQLQDSQDDLSNTEENYSHLSESYAQLEATVAELEVAVSSRDQEILKLAHLHEATQDDLSKAKSEFTNTASEADRYKEDCDALRGKVEELESILSAKSGLIEELEDEAVQLKRINELHENRLKEATYELNRRSEELDSVNRESVRMEALSSSYSDLQHSSEEVRTELEQALARNAELTSKLRDTQEHSR